MKFNQFKDVTEIAPSLPVRGAWIEIKTCRLCIKTVYVAPRAGSVD